MRSSDKTRKDKLAWPTAALFINDLHQQRAETQFENFVFQLCLCTDDFVLFVLFAKMKVATLNGFDDVAFGSSSAVLSARGKPTQQIVNTRGETECWYAEMVFRFAADKFVEVSFKTPEQLEIDGEVVASDTLLGFMKNRDKEYFEALGFGVAPCLGLAYDLEHDGSWTTAFMAGRWDKLREANKRMHRTPR